MGNSELKDPPVQIILRHERSYQPSAISHQINQNSRSVFLIADG